MGDIGTANGSLKAQGIPHPRHRSGGRNGLRAIPRMEVRAPAGGDDIASMAAISSTRTLLPFRGRAASGSPAGETFRGRAFLLGLTGLFALYVGWLLIDPGSAKWLYNVLLVGSAFVCLSSPLRRTKEGAAWLCLGITLLLWAAGDFYYTVFLWNQNATPPTVTDWLWLASYPFLYASIALLVRSRTAHFERSLWLDAILAALAVAAVGAAVLFGAVVESTGGSTFVAAMNLAYPLADALLLGIVVAVLALTGWRLDRTWSAIAAGTAVLALTDSAVLYQASSGSGQLPILDAGWPLAMLLLAAAAWQPVRELGTVRLEGARLLAIPAVFGLTSLAILVYGQFASLNAPAVVLAATSMLAVIARMALTFGEKLKLLSASRIEARTDPLTGIGNRRKLVDDLTATLSSQEPAVLILLDLDGFKGYNDSFGHPAGDALLARLAKKLAAAVSGHKGAAGPGRSTPASRERAPPRRCAERCPPSPPPRPGPRRSRPPARRRAGRRRWRGCRTRSRHRGRARRGRHRAPARGARGSSGSSRDHRSRMRARAR